ncbi:hypothetical protein ACXR6G_20045, partial [Ancylomarina sp. YFZ004]
KTIDLTPYLDDTDSKLTENEVDVMVDNNGYIRDFVNGNQIKLDGNQAGDLAYFDGVTWMPIVKGSEGQVLEMKDGIPAWSNNQSIQADKVLHGLLQYDKAGAYEFVVPGNVTRIFVKIYGASGGRNQKLYSEVRSYGSGGIAGGRGGYIYTSISVFPGEVISFYNGASGVNYCSDILSYDYSFPLCNLTYYGELGYDGEDSYVLRSSNSEKIIIVEAGKGATEAALYFVGTGCNVLRGSDGRAPAGFVSVIPGKGIFPISIIKGEGVISNPNCSDVHPDGIIEIEW